MPKSSVLRLLSEVVKSYSSCTQLITQYTYTAAQTPLVHEVRPASGYEFFNEIHKDLLAKMSMSNFKKKLCAEEQCLK